MCVFCSKILTLIYYFVKKKKPGLNGSCLGSYVLHDFWVGSCLGSSKFFGNGFELNLLTHKHDPFSTLTPGLDLKAFGAKAYNFLVLIGPGWVGPVSPRIFTNMITIIMLI
ncbi:hypothetical protein Hdeb2414_s0006g00219911 [Helianthus debilis subsp. tardiflorus]